MTRSEFIAVTAAILFGVFLLGWLTSWIVHRMTRPARPEEAEAGPSSPTAQDHVAAQQREAELRSRLATAEADAQAALDALRDSRIEVEELRDYIDQRLARR